jgi:hypothetical protein
MLAVQDENSKFYVLLVLRAELGISRHDLLSQISMFSTYDVFS